MIYILITYHVPKNIGEFEIMGHFLREKKEISIYFNTYIYNYFIIHI